MIKSQMVGQTLVCVIGGKLYQKSIENDAEKLRIYEQALNTNENDEEEVKSLVSIFERTRERVEIEAEQKIEKLKSEAEVQKTLLTWMEEVKSNGDDYFEVVGIKLYMKGINITVPEFLALEFAKRRDNQEDLQSLMNFWKLCALNSDPRCREDLYKFLMNHDMVVTPSGHFMAYRNVAIKNDNGVNRSGNKKLNSFIGEQWIKTKSQKKSPKNFEILELVDNPKDKNKDHFIKKSTSWFKNVMAGDDDYKVIGNLQDLYDKLGDVEEESTTVYTDNHTKTMEIVIGQRVSIDRSECDANPDRDCSRGLHLGSPSFVTRGNFGNEGLICLCNPMHVVAVPYAGGEKLRCCEYLPIGITTYGEDGRIIPVDTATFEYEYIGHNQQMIEEMLKNATLESLKEHEIVPKEIDIQSLKNINEGLKVTLNDMNNIVQKRVIKVN